ncbi:hypothetical protein PIB30_022961 [Stylosanthes scabra]|uniref:Uncharacterized protein n=1 Tax=Stylosanthes scabra TaxID=79078 RepID=A0ABU6S9C9_9FABA|nr:hypothetical protein [Stylosanthes scabra]
MSKHRVVIDCYDKEIRFAGGKSEGAVVAHSYYLRVMSNSFEPMTGHREEEMNQERMRYDQILQEAAAQQAREANKGKTREVVPDSEEEEGSEELHSSASEEW